MKVLVIGSGGREHALCWKIAQSPLVELVLCAPGNGGIAAVARCESVSPTDVSGLVELARREGVGLVVVGPEASLVAGVVDAMTAVGIPAFGPTAAAARLEGSKAFSKEFMRRHGIPTAAFSVHHDLHSAINEIDRRQGPCVVKADGLAAGKGVIVCRSPYEARSAVREMLDERRFGEAGAQVVIEDLIEGEEASVLALCDGERVVPLVAAQDHKRAYEGDTGPNTGGMGAYAPAAVVTAALAERIRREVLEPTVRGMAADGTPFRGVLYAGLMIRGDELMVLEYNARFGDPETQPLMMLLQSDLVPVLLGAAQGQMQDTALAFHPGAALSVVLVADGYPGPFEKGKPISGLDEVAHLADVQVFHAGTRRDGERLLTAGGRVLNVTGLGPTVHAAAERAYAAAERISFEGMRMRYDIGHRAR